MSKARTHAAFGYFTLCGRYPKGKYIYVTKRKRIKQIDCKICVKEIRRGMLPLFPEGK